MRRPCLIWQVLIQLAGHVLYAYDTETGSNVTCGTYFAGEEVGPFIHACSAVANRIRIQLTDPRSTSIYGVNVLNLAEVEVYAYTCESAGANETYQSDLSFEFGFRSTLPSR